MVQDSPSRRMDQFIVRLPDGMRDRIKAAAEDNNRSMNAEIVATLENAYPAPFEYDNINHHFMDTLERAFRLRREISKCVEEIENAKDEEEQSALFERYRALEIVDKQVHYELKSVMANIEGNPHLDVAPKHRDKSKYSDGYGDGDGAYGDSDGNGDGMGGRS